MAKNRYFQPQEKPQVQQDQTQEQEQLQEPQTEQAQTVGEQQAASDKESATQEVTQEPTQALEKQVQSDQPKAQDAPKETPIKAPVVQSEVAAAQDKPIANEVLVPADIEKEVKEDFFKFLKHFSATADDSTKAWARNILNVGVKYKRKRPLDTKGCLEASMFAFNAMSSAIMYADAAQQRMRFIYACFKWCDCIFDLELTGRGANQLTAQQYKQYTALSSLFYYWAELGNGSEINKRFNVAKEMSAVFDPVLAQRVVAVVGA